MNAGRTPRVLMILYNPGLGGPGRIARSLAASLKSRMQISVVAPSAGKTAAALQSEGIPVDFVPRERLRATWNPAPHVKYLLRFPGTVAGYRRMIRRAQPDLVHVDHFMNLPALVAAWLCRVKTLVHLQEVPSGFPRSTLAFVAGILSDRVVAVSQASAKPLARRLAPGKVSVVCNGTRVWNSVPAYPPNGWVVFVGRLSEDKDPIFFVRAAEKVAEQEPGARFMICGMTVPGREGYESALFRTLSQSAILQENFTVFRDREDVETLLQGSSVFVNCSAVPEALPLSVLEAMAQARPVVVPRWGVFPEIITDGVTGLLYCPGNLDELAQRILSLLRDPSLAEKIGCAGQLLVRDRFTEEKMVSGMREQYEQLLGCSSLRPS